VKIHFRSRSLSGRSAALPYAMSRNGGIRKWIFLRSRQQGIPHTKNTDQFSGGPRRQIADRSIILEYHNKFNYFIVFFILDRGPAFVIMNIGIPNAKYLIAVS
jgi:hypothetical protein